MGCSNSFADAFSSSDEGRKSISMERTFRDLRDFGLICNKVGVFWHVY